MEHVSNRPLPQQLQRPQVLQHEAMGMTDHQVHLGLFAGGDDGAALVYGYAQRLLGEHVLTGLRRSDRDFTVQRMGQTDDDRIYRRVVQNGAVVRIDMRHVMCSGECAARLLHSRPRQPRSAPGEQMPTRARAIALCLLYPQCRCSPYPYTPLLY